MQWARLRRVSNQGETVFSVWQRLDRCCHNHQWDALRARLGVMDDMLPRDAREALHRLISGQSEDQEQDRVIVRSGLEAWVEWVDAMSHYMWNAAHERINQYNDIHHADVSRQCVVPCMAEFMWYKLCLLQGFQGSEEVRDFMSLFLILEVEYHTQARIQRERDA
jgi:hypothetical protein